MSGICSCQDRAACRACLRPGVGRDLVAHGEELIERPHGNLLANWLPGIYLEILPRRNPAARRTCMFCPTVASWTHPYPRMYRALNSPAVRTKWRSARARVRSVAIEFGM